MIANMGAIANTVLTRLTELTSLTQAQLEQTKMHLMLQRYSAGVPLTQEQAGLLLDVTKNQLQKMIRIGEAAGIPTPRWRIHQRGYRWDGRRLPAWAQLCGSLLAGKSPAELSSLITDFIQEGPPTTTSASSTSAPHNDLSQEQ